MSKNNNDLAESGDLIKQLIDSKLPLDWVTLEQFGNLIGYPSARLYHAKSDWPEGVVWQKLGGKLYFSIEGWNKWLSDQSIQAALEYEAAASKLTYTSRARENISPRRTQQRRKASATPQNYELT